MAIQEKAFCKFSNNFLQIIFILTHNYFHKRHMVSAPSLYDQYGGDGFPGLSDAIFNLSKNETVDNVKEVEKELSIAIYVVQSASSILRGPNNFDRYF